MEKLSTIPTANYVTSLIDASHIAARVKEIAHEINTTYQNSNDPLILVSVLKGSVIFTADLCRHLTIPVELEFMSVSSYGNETQSSGEIKVGLDLSKSLTNRHVLIVEDIVDTGLTAQYLLDKFTSHNPASLKLCSLLHKPSRSINQLIPDITGFTIANEFVVGYGLDYAGIFRNLPFIGILHNA